MPRRSRRWVWAGRAVSAVIVAGLVGYLVVAGLERADKLASAISAVVAVAALAAPYLFPVPASGNTGVSKVGADQVEDSGTARATGGGQANTGVDGVGNDRPAQVTRSGDATATGPGSVANTGVRRRRQP